MKYIITCPFCGNAFTVEENGQQEFLCPTCGGPNTLENAVVMHDQKKIDEEVKRNVNAAVRKALIEKELQEQAEEEKEEDLKIRNALLKSGIGIALLILIALSAEMCGI